MYSPGGHHVGHFFCGVSVLVAYTGVHSELNASPILQMCASYVQALAKVPTDALDAAGTKIVLIGCGAWDMIPTYQGQCSLTNPLSSFARARAPPQDHHSPADPPRLFFFCATHAVFHASACAVPLELSRTRRRRRGLGVTIHTNELPDNSSLIIRMHGSQLVLLFLPDLSPRTKGPTRPSAIGPLVLLNYTRSRATW